MKRWQKAAILLAITPLLAVAAWFCMGLVKLHIFFVAKCNAFYCEDDGAGLYSAVAWIVGITFTIYFFFAFRWLFKLPAGDAKRD